MTACWFYQVCDSTIVSESDVPHVTIYRERVEFIGKNRANNISILLWNITFEDGGEYTCFGRNPKEKGKNHSAIFHLIVVDECEWSKSMVLCADMCAVVHFPPVRHLNIYITRQFLGPRLMAPRNAYWFESKLEKRIPLMLNYKKKA